MKYLKNYKIFESENNLDLIANQFIDDMSKIYDLRSKGNPWCQIYYATPSIFWGYHCTLGKSRVQTLGVPITLGKIWDYLYGLWTLFSKMPRAYLEALFKVTM